MFLPKTPQPGEAAPRLHDFLDQKLFLDMKQCPQEAQHHGEGDVLNHTQMVCDQLVNHPTWLALDDQEREDLWWAALLHDSAKPFTTREEDGRLRAPGHASAGAVYAREILWRMGVSPERREKVCALVHWHMTPYHLLDRDNPEKIVAEISLSVRPELLALLVECDSQGRIADDLPRLKETIDIFRIFCEDLGCLDGAYPFTSDHARVMFFRKDDRAIDYQAFDDTEGQMTMMIGLPGSGKDFWISKHGDAQPVISLDDLRVKNKVKRGDKKAEGQMIAESRELVREQLRAKSNFIYNATNLSKQQRERVLGLAADYNTRIRLVIVEAPMNKILMQNRNRPAQEIVPESAYAGLLRHWEIPSLAEAHEIIWT